MEKGKQENENKSPVLEEYFPLTFSCSQPLSSSVLYHRSGMKEALVKGAFLAVAQKRLPSHVVVEIAWWPHNAHGGTNLCVRGVTVTLTAHSSCMYCRSFAHSLCNLGLVCHSFPHSPSGPDRPCPKIASELMALSRRTPIDLFPQPELLTSPE